MILELDRATRNPKEREEKVAVARSVSLSPLSPSFSFFLFFSPRRCCVMVKLLLFALPCRTLVFICPPPPVLASFPQPRQTNVPIQLSHIYNSLLQIKGVCVRGIVSVLHCSKQISGIRPNISSSCPSNPSGHYKRLITHSCRELPSRRRRRVKKS
jgi:hypothetical protein